MDSKKEIEQPTLAEMIGATLSDLRKKSGLTQKEFAQIFNVSEDAISHYEQGINLINIELLCKIADYFQVSADYLLGRSLGKFDYSKLNDKLSQDMTLGEMVNTVVTFSKGEKKYLSQTVLLLKNQKSKK